MDMKRLMIILLVLSVGPSFSQSESDNKDKPRKEIVFSLSLGRSLGGPAREIESAMIAAGFDDEAQEFFGTGTIEHPRKTSYFVYDIEGTLYLRDQMGITLNAARVDRSNVDGYKGVDPYPTLLGGYLFLESELRSVSVCYTYRTKNKAHAFFAGPAYLMHRVQDESAPLTGGKVQKSNKPGLMLGYTFQVVNQKIWGVALKANYRWCPKTTLGPFATSREDIVLPETKIGLSTFNAGISVMLKLRA